MIKNLKKLPRRKVTIDELLGCDDLTEMAAICTKEREGIKDCLLIYSDSNGVLHFRGNGLKYERALWLIEQTKLWLLQEE